MVQPALRITNIKPVDLSFNSRSMTSKRVLSNLAHRNEVRIRPHRIAAAVESGRVVQSTVTASNIVAQAFVSEFDNIYDTSLVLELNGTPTVIDNFESYNNSAELQAAWPAVVNDAELEEVVVSPNASSTQSMRVQLDNPNDAWTKTVVLDLTDKQINFDAIQTVPGIVGNFSFFIGDGVNTKSINIADQFASVWVSHSVGELDLVEDGAGTTDVSAITEIGFRVNNKQNNSFVYIDNLTFSDGFGNVEIKLFRMGSNIPEPGVAKISDGTQYTTLGDLGISGKQLSSVTIPLKAGKKTYRMEDFSAGVGIEIPGNVLLVPGDYYILTISYVDVNVKVYGTDPSFNIDYYPSGYAFTAPDEDTAITKIGEFNDIAFKTTANVDAQIVGIQFCVFNASNEVVSPSSDSDISIYIEGPQMEHLSDELVHGNGIPPMDIDLHVNSEFCPRGGKVELYYTSGESDIARSLFLCALCLVNR